MRKDNLKVMSRLKRIYKSGHDWYFDAVEKVSNRIGLPTIRRCESVKDFLDRSKYAKLLKKTRVPFRSKMGQIEQHRKNKKSRVEAQQQIQEGLREWDEIFEDTSTCDYCSYFKRSKCVNYICIPKFADDLICGDFRVLTF